MKRALVVLTIILAAFGGAGAQDAAELVEMRTMDGLLAVRMPDDWAARLESGVIVLSNSGSALETGAPAVGEIMASVLSPDALRTMGIEAATAEPIVEALIERLNVTGGMKPYEDAGVSGAWALVMDGTHRAGQIVALDFETGPVAILVDYGSEFPENAGWYVEQVRQIVRGVTYNGQSAADGMVDALPADAAQVRQWAVSVTGSSQFTQTSWGFMQAAGAPDTEDCGDRVTAWTSERPSGHEFLTLTYEQAVYPTQVNVYQTQSPGAIVRIELTNTATGDVFAVPDSADPVGNTPCPGVFTVDVPAVDAPVNSVTLYLDQAEVGWNEIDAVELVGLSASTAAEAPNTAGGDSDAEPLTEANAVTAGFWTLLHRFEYSGEFMIDYPAGWILNLDELPLVATSEEALDMMQRGETLPEGEIAIRIIPPSGYGEIGVRPRIMVSQVATDVAAAYGVAAKIQPFNDAPMLAYYTLADGAEALPAPSYLVSFAHDSGVYTLAVATDDFEPVRPLLAGMMGTLKTP